MMDGIRIAHADRAVKKPTVLLVDDAPGIRLMVSLCLRARGFDIVEAATTEVAMEVVDREAIDLVFSDVSAGSKIDGLKFLNWLLQSRPDLPLLLASSDAKKAQEARKMHPHATVFTKPYDIDRVAESVDAVLGGVRGIAESVAAE